MKKILTGLLLIVSWHTQGQDRKLLPDQTLWFTYPATDWKTQALHIGNGYMGASFYGGVARERFDIAEKSFWAGGPNVSKDYNYGVKHGGSKYINLIRQKVVEGDYAASDSLSYKYLMGDWKDYGYFSNVGSLFIDFKHGRGAPSDYIRGLDVANSEGFVGYTINGVKFNRTYFASYPNKVFAFRFSANKPGNISFSLSQTITKRIDSISFEGDGKMVVHGLIEENGLKYCIRITVIATGGTVSHSWDKIKVDKADSATILYTVGTEYKMQPPLYKGADPESETRKVMETAISKGYDELKILHRNDYKAIYDRVKLNLTGDTKLEKLPTNERVVQRQKGTIDDAALDVLWFNLGRYMIISASRKGTLPSTLTGVWNTFEAAPWQGCYQLNIGTEEMYWACESTNIPESHESF
ncbi:MAG: glycoside hydrolase family 95 protein, partial [Chitinophagaceae bacterium]|nr:glycoside hydrolase family 95 protein [Chitinophagaceae bacterium]